MAGARPRRRLGASALVLALVLTACSGADPADGDNAGLFDERQAAQSADDASARAVLATREVIIALNDERIVAAAGLLGATVQTRVANNTEGRRLTDEALAGFQSTLAGLEADIGAPYESALDAGEDLDSLRGEIDGHPGPAGISEIEYADGVFDRYGGVIDLLIDADRTVTHSIDDPDLRRGVDLFTIGLQQNELTGRAVRTVLLGTVDDGTDTSAEIAEAAALHTALIDGLATVTETAAGTDFAPAAEQLAADVAAAGFLDTLFALLESGQADAAAVVDSVNASGDHGWSEFLDRVEAIVDDTLA